MEMECRYACAYIPLAPSPSSAYAVVWRSRLGLRSRPRPRPRLAPSSPPLHSLSPPLCSTERAGFKLRRSAHVPTHSQRWRSAGARAGTSSPSLSSSHRPSRAHLSSLDAYGYARAVELERGADSDVYVGVWSAPHPRPLTPRHRTIEAVCLCISVPASLSSSYADAEGAYAPPIWVQFGFRCTLARRWQCGCRHRAGACTSCLAISLSFS
jgi:hypothetical protein